MDGPSEQAVARQGPRPVFVGGAAAAGADEPLGPPLSSAQAGLAGRLGLARVSSGGGVGAIIAEVARAAHVGLDHCVIKLSDFEVLDQWSDPWSRGSVSLVMISNSFAYDCGIRACE